MSTDTHFTAATAEHDDGAELPFTLYVTYGYNTNLRHNYSVVKGLDYAACRATVDMVTKGQFAFDYTEARFAGQIERYGLSEVPLQPHVHL